MESNHSIYYCYTLKIVVIGEETNMSKSYLPLILTVILTAALCVSACAQWSSPIQVSNTSKIFTYHPKYDFDANGFIHIVYQNWDDGTPDLYYGHNMYGSFTQDNINDADSPNIVITQSDQTLHFFRENNDQIYERTKPVSGGSWSSSIRVDQNPYGGYLNDVIVDESDGIYCAWGHLFDPSWSPNSGAYGRYKLLGGSYGATEFIEGRTNDIWPQNLRFYPKNGKIYGAYRLTNYSDGARLRIRSSTGVWGPEILADSDGYGGYAAVDSNGQIAMVFGQPDPTPEGGVDWNICYRYSVDDGANWSPKVTLKDTPDLCRSPHAIFDDHNNLHVAYEGRYSEWDDFKLYVRSRIGGVWYPEEMIEDDTGVPVNALKYNDGTLYMAYSHNYGTGYGTEVYIKTKDMNYDDTAPGPVTGLTATAGENMITLNWTNPSDSDYLATMVRADTGGFPSGPFDGREVCIKQNSPGSVDSFVDYPLNAGWSYLYSVYAQDTSGNWSVVAQASATVLTDVTPPSNVTLFTATPYSSKRLNLQWTNPSNIDFKGTMVRYSTSGYPSSPTSGSLACNQTASPGSTDTFTHENLTAGITYYYTAFSYDWDNNYASGVNASGVPLQMDIPYIKEIPNGNTVEVYDKVVTAIFASDSAVYIQEPDEPAAIRVSNSGSGLSVGDRVNVSGTISTRTSGGLERQITSGSITKLGPNTPLEPLHMQNTALGGASIEPYIDGAQDYDGTLVGGANNIGLLVKITGKVTEKLSTYIWVDDGSELLDAGGSRVGVLVKCPSSSIPCEEGDIVSVTGIAEGSLPLGYSLNRRFVHMRTFGDLQVHEYDSEGTITGHVYDNASNPVSGATVSTDTGGYSTTSATDGSYTIASVETGTYDVTASKSGYTSDTETGVYVPAGGSVTVDFSLTPTNGVIAGVVKDTSDNPVAGATVATSTGGYSTTSGSDGSYTLANVDPGTYSVTASKTGYTPDTETGVVVTAGNTTTANFAMAPQPGSITGYVRDSSSNPISGATVSTNSGGYSTTSGTDGSYTLSNVSQGTYSVTASATNYYSGTNAGVVVLPGTPTTSNFALNPQPGTISGYVKDTSNNPLAGATVSTNYGGYTTSSGSDGFYQLNGVAPGTYNVIATKSSYFPQTQYSQVVNSNQTTTVNFNLTYDPSSEQVTNGNFSGGFFNFWGGDIGNNWGAGWTSGYSDTDDGIWDDQYAGSTYGYAQELQAKTAGIGVGIVQELTGLTPGASYTFSAETYRSGGDYSVYIGTRDGIGHGSVINASQSLQYSGGTGAWIYRQITGTVPAGGAITIYVWATKNSGGNYSVFVDNVSFIGY